MSWRHINPFLLTLNGFFQWYEKTLKELPSEVPGDAVNDLYALGSHLVEAGKELVKRVGTYNSMTFGTGRIIVAKTEKDGFHGIILTDSFEDHDETELGADMKTYDLMGHPGDWTVLWFPTAAQRDRVAEQLLRSKDDVQR